MVTPLLIALVLQAVLAEEEVKTQVRAARAAREQLVKVIMVARVTPHLMLGPVLAAEAELVLLDKQVV